MSVTSILSLCVFIFNTLAVISIIFVERKHPNTALAWILTIIFLPIIGLITYTIFGTTFLMRRRLKIELSNVNLHLKSHSLFQELSNLPVIKIEDATVNDVMHKIALLNQRNENLRVSHGNNMRIYIDANLKYNDLLSDINNAQHSIHLLYFIIHGDHIGKKILSALTKRAQEGITVRLMFDVNASRHLPRALLQDLTNAGGQICRFLPSFFKNLLRINYRMHRKIAVIDGRIAYTGGMNLGDEYAGLNPRITPWRDTHLRIQGNAVHALQLCFLLDWHSITRERLFDHSTIFDYFPALDKPLNLTQKKHMDSLSDIPIQVISSGPNQVEMDIRDAMITMINTAKNSIIIQTPYFIPDDPFMQALILAAKTGIQISIMIPGIPDKKFIYTTTLAYTEELIQYGIKIYAYHGFIHAKMLMIDGKICTIGTANIDYRSFELNFEVNTFIYDIGFCQYYLEIFNNDILSCSLLTEDYYKNRPRLARLCSITSKLLSPLM